MDMIDEAAQLEQIRVWLARHLLDGCAITAERIIDARDADHDEALATAGRLDHLRAALAARS